MSQTAIPCLFMRGGTSRGPYFRRSDLPEDQDKLAEVLIAAVGAGHPLTIDGVGGGAPVTTKVAMLSKSDHDWAAVDYFFAQVSVEERRVDFSPTCGNILSGVGPAAIEMGLVAAEAGVTEVPIRATNTGALIEARVQTPGGAVEYEGDGRIDGVPGTAAPVLLNFRDVVGSKTGALLPCGQAREEVEGIEVSCVDAAMPMVIARAESFGLTGAETSADLDDNADFFARMEAIRRAAGRRMGLGDVAGKVVPKFGLLSAPRQGGAITSRYFVPTSCHPSHAVTGAICVGACLLAPGSVAEGLAQIPDEMPATLAIEHPSGQIEVSMDYELRDGALDLKSAGLLRTARKLMAGELFVPSRVWDGR